MKRLILISLLTSIMMFTTGLYQLMKIPFLYEHYLEHTKHNNELSAFDFICMHYSGENKHTNTHQQDKKLPFKTNDEIISTTLFAASFNNTIKICKPIIPLSRVYVIKDEKRTPSSYSANIWQPPKQG